MKRTYLMICLLVGILLLVADCSNALITPLHHNLGGSTDTDSNTDGDSNTGGGSTGGGSTGSGSVNVGGNYDILGKDDDISQNIKPPTSGLTDKYLEEVEDLLDDVYDETDYAGDDPSDYDNNGFNPDGEYDSSYDQSVDQNPAPPTEPQCGCGCGPSASCVCTSCTGKPYEGSYNGYFKDVAGNKYFMTKAISRAVSGSGDGRNLHYRYSSTISKTIEVDRDYTGDLGDITSINAYFNFQGKLYSSSKDYVKYAGYANWRGYIENITHDSSKGVILPNNVLPDISICAASQTDGRYQGYDQTPDYWKDSSYTGNNDYLVEVNGIPRTTYHVATDGDGIELSVGDGDDYTELDTYFILNLSKFPCGMDESLVKILSM